ncbi:MAG: hypothetical protein JXA30_20160, partial [Deltaproteobacteria bacterium]|nr:hypothetical protein [Deltaproteobacteria bacterium]
MKIKYLSYLLCVFSCCACSAENKSTKTRDAPSIGEEGKGNEDIPDNSDLPFRSNNESPSRLSQDASIKKEVTTVEQDGGTVIELVSIDECPGPLHGDLADSLEKGGSVDSSMKWLYPYDGTVFPGGIVSPTLQWQPQGGGTEAIMLKMTSERFSYRGCFGRADPARLIIPRNVWDEAYKNQAPFDNLKVELTTASEGVVSGPITQVWRFARGKLRGDVYYSTYDSILVNGGDPLASNGAVLRIKPDQTKPEVFLSTPGIYPFGPCISCHSLSANGGTMLAELHTYPTIANVGLFASSSYDLEANPNPQPQPNPGILDEAAFGGLYPDGSRYMSNGSPTDSTT